MNANLPHFNLKLNLQGQNGFTTFNGFWRNLSAYKYHSSTQKNVGQALLLKLLKKFIKEF